jgi:hypothetical protein
MAGSKMRATDCEDALRALSGVRVARASALTGNLLVLYNPHLVRVTQIRDRCAAWVHDPAAAPRCTPDSHGHGHTGHAFALEVVAVTLAHILGHGLSDAFWTRLPRVGR